MLAHSLVTAKGAEPGKTMLFLHGILGNRANWRGIARRFVEARPDWGAVLVDLREHGDSLGLAGPHGLAAAARDLSALESSLDTRVEGALGHSFGGKVVLTWLRSRGGRPTDAWIIDASPSKTSPSRAASAAAEVLDVLGALPRRWASRAEFVDAIVDAGQSESIAQWLAMNLRRTEDGGRIFGPALAVIHELVSDYAETDCWSVIESPPEACAIHLVIGDRSVAYSREDRSRASEIAKGNPAVALDTIEDAGHWVHVDRPDALLELLAEKAI